MLNPGFRPCLLGLWCFLYHPFVAAQELASQNQMAMNMYGCGTGWNYWLVPDSIPLLQCDFFEACKQHDICYGQCEGRQEDHNAPQCAYLQCRKGGKSYMSKQCETSVTLVSSMRQADERRIKCDARLKEDIQEINLGKPVCQAFAYVYHYAVRKFGDGAFFGIDVLTGKTLEQQKDEYDKSIEEYFRFGTNEQFENLVNSVNKGKPLVDLTEPIVFDKKQGLINKPQVH